MPCSLPLPLLAAGQSVVNVYINKDKNFAFVEFRTGGGGQLRAGWLLSRGNGGREGGQEV
jgi:hypothetical protein